MNSYLFLMAGLSLTLPAPRSSDAPLDIRRLHLSPTQQAQWNQIERSFAAQRSAVRARIPTDAAGADFFRRLLRDLNAAERATKRSILTPAQRLALEGAGRVRPTEPSRRFGSGELVLRDDAHQEIDLTQWRGRTVVLVPWEVGITAARTLRAVDALALRHPKAIFLSVNVSNTEQTIFGWRNQRGPFPNLRFARTQGNAVLERLPGAVILAPDQRSEARVAAGPMLIADLERRLSQKTK